MNQKIKCERVREDSQRVAKNFNSTLFWSSAGRLISHLMWRATNGSWQVVDDGIVAAWEKRTVDKIECAGVLSSLDEHFVWPVRFLFEFDAQCTDIEQGWVGFGSCNWGARKWGSEEHRALMAKIKNDEEFEMDWMRVFRLNREGWSIELPNYVEIN